MDQQQIGIDPVVFGKRLRHARRARGLTLDALGARVGRPAPYLSQLETGKREPRLSLVGALADALGVTASELIATEAPSRRAQLEIALERAQQDPLYRSLGLAPLKASARVPDDALEHLVALYRHLSRHVEEQAQSPEGARRANAQLRHEMRAQDNYMPRVEELARDVLNAVAWDGSSALPERTLSEIGRHLGFTVRRVRGLPRHTRSVADLIHRVVYIPQRDVMSTRDARSVVLQTLGHFALGHRDPSDFADYLRQRVEANYFAGAILAPEDAVVPFLRDAKHRRELSVDDLKQVFNISYEMAAHRFTNLATRHLNLRVHFLRSDAEGVIWKAYENDGLPFPADASGSIEGQKVCRYWGAKMAFESDDTFNIHYQYTETPAGVYWSGTYVEADRGPQNAVTVGVRERDARYFRGHDADRRWRSRCPDRTCCRTPSGAIAQRWAGNAWAASSEHSHAIAVRAIGAFPGVDLADVYAFLEHQTANGNVHSNHNGNTTTDRSSDVTR